MHNAYIIELTAKFVAIVPKIMSIYLILVLYIAFYILQNSIVSSPKTQEIAFQRLLISNFSGRRAPGPPMNVSSMSAQLVIPGYAI